MRKKSWSAMLPVSILEAQNHLPFWNSEIFCISTSVRTIQYSYIEYIKSRILPPYIGEEIMEACKQALEEIPWCELLASEDACPVVLLAWKVASILLDKVGLLHFHGLTLELGTVRTTKQTRFVCAILASLSGWKGILDDEFRWWREKPHPYSRYGCEMNTTISLLWWWTTSLGLLCFVRCTPRVSLVKVDEWFTRINTVYERENCS